MAPGDERLRITIGGKVFGIALLLVVLMGVAAAVSSFLVRDAAFALTRVNQTYGPLSEAIAEVGVGQLEQELAALELFADLRDPGCQVVDKWDVDDPESENVQQPLRQRTVPRPDQHEVGLERHHRFGRPAE